MAKKITFSRNNQEFFRKLIKKIPQKSAKDKFKHIPAPNPVWNLILYIADKRDGKGGLNIGTNYIF